MAQIVRQTFFYQFTRTLCSTITYYIFDIEIYYLNSLIDIAYTKIKGLITV